MRRFATVLLLSAPALLAGCGVSESVETLRDPLWRDCYKEALVQLKARKIPGVEDLQRENASQREELQRLASRLAELERKLGEK